ncbi:hypothetical protein AVEN_212257-1 [Araneus ventricosus]|uniref:Uncharacterized protein n=1 Tax=Araneus ventricosus TaxID=182803 RepID=A0A4Y2UIS1_ARAVE|nr:hypothetical protein AVEN_212257-1 [Araneus ventricosus]
MSEIDMNLWFTQGRISKKRRDPSNLIQTKPVNETRDGAGRAARRSGCGTKVLSVIRMTNFYGHTSVDRERPDTRKVSSEKTITDTYLPRRIIDYPSSCIKTIPKYNA